MLNKKLNILFLCSWFPNPENKSNGIFIKHHAQVLAMQHNVTVLFVKSLDNISKAYTTTVTEKNYTEQCLFYPKVKIEIPFLSSIKKFSSYLSHYKSLLNNTQKENASFDIIHLNTIFPAAIPTFYALKKYPQAKLFITEHWSGYYPEDKNYKGFFTKLFTKKIVKKATSVFVINNRLQSAMENHNLVSNYELVNNTVNTTVFYPVNSDINTNENILKILHVSSLVNREKNIVDIISIVEKLKANNVNCNLTIIGENKDEQSFYEKLISEKKLKDIIIFIGYKTQTEIACYLNNSDVFLLFSNFEGMPNVLLESLACGLPVITTNVGMVTKMIPEKMGIILKTNSINECVTELQKYKRASFLNKEAMHQHIEITYSALAVSNQITSLYQKYL